MPNGLLSISVLQHMVNQCGIGAIEPLLPPPPWPVRAESKKPAGKRISLRVLADFSELYSTELYLGVRFLLAGQYPLSLSDWTRLCVPSVD